MSQRTPKWQEGAVVQIPLGEGWHSYARLRKEPTVSFYNLRSRGPCVVDEVVSSPISFSIWVMRRALQLWPTVEVRPLDVTLHAPESFVKRDKISGKVTVYTQGQEVPADECAILYLEVAAVWDPEHVEGRLRDYYEGKPNKWVDSLRASVAGRA